MPKSIRENGKRGKEKGGKLLTIKARTGLTV
jgi:hypothetical protein